MFKYNVINSRAINDIWEPIQLVKTLARESGDLKQAYALLLQFCKITKSRLS